MTAAAFRLCELRNDPAMWLRMARVCLRRSQYPGLDAAYCERKYGECITAADATEKAEER
jgi:hypothetical protein